MSTFILALDQGTTSSRALVFDEAGKIRALAQKEFTQYFPRPGWVEHDPLEIWGTQRQAALDAVAAAGLSLSDIAAVGIANQRETVAVWDRKTGEPLHRAIVWQCRRTSELCAEYASRGLGEEIAKRTGLVLDPYFSGTKIRWLLDNVPEVRRAADEGRVLFGTIDAWLSYRLTGRALTDPSNASRTLLYNIHTGTWDDELLRIFGIRKEWLPELVPSSGALGRTEWGQGSGPSLAGIAGDQQAALFGQAAFGEGQMKNTYGTGCFMLRNTGKTPVHSSNGLLTTVAWDLGTGLEYAIEGSVFVAGAVIQWMRDQLGILPSAVASQEAAFSVPDTAGVVVVPAFVGLGAPHWDPHARGAILGLTRGSGRAHLVRAGLESIAFQSADLVTAMDLDCAGCTPFLRVDGGASRNEFLMQFQADILGVPVERPVVTETTAFGAACLAGLGVGVFADRDAVSKLFRVEKTYEPRMDPGDRARRRRRWETAVRAVRAYGSGD